MAVKRVNEEPAYILHRYDWSESSLVLECFTRHRGRVALVAKGVKKPTSNFRPVLLALQPLRLSWGIAGEGASDIHTLKSAEWVGGHTMPVGGGLLSGLYLNELLMRLLAREDPFANLFDIYAGVVRVLATDHGEVLEPVLRAFELLLLRELGLLPSLAAQTLSLQPLQASTRYVLVPDAGLREAHGQDRAGLSGAQWEGLEEALSAANPYPAVLRACVLCAGELKVQLRTLLQHHCGQPVLRTRQLMMDIQSL
ncbi:MAG: DNA repair protein RecO [Comamonas sp.]|jgi:DNA repair protein RecO (recombination protein O)|uniref:DNA repair protein RecO n=1 Tax=Comamonas sp. JUb58 TaxID=2485114 RepID=UPI00106009F6|nr:DNA repair protein RecO [Comamonas sp. JUb58]MDR0261478.1 DNA repair protein RecO [Comamonas sp.]TDS84039.1 DNA replication and repair protein RecO [Comamonas sp. JUb58]